MLSAYGNPRAGCRCRSRFSTVPRDLIRVVGAVFAVCVALWLGALVLAMAAAGLITSLIDDTLGGDDQLTTSPFRIAICLAGIGLGALQGALVAGYGPIVFAASAIAILLAISLRRSQAYRRRRHCAAFMGLVFLSTFAVSNILVGAYILGSP